MSALLTMALGPAAWAWSSTCFVDAEHRTCEDGMEKARHPWVSERDDLSELEEPEHAQLLEEAVGLSGIPVAVIDPITVRHAASGAPRVGVDMFDWYESVDPTMSEPAVVSTRTVRASGMAQLPDHSYTLWDWARGNETCPPDPNLDTTRCHTFTTHMGALNASHFPPQSQYFYAYYHALAMARAGECGLLDADIHAQDDVAHLDRHVLACEKQAMLLESIGQHYLQDAWSSGHMWERWGGVMHEDFPSLPVASLIAAYAGSWHGAKALADELLADPDLPEGLPEHADDPMCAPPPVGHEVVYVDPVTGLADDAIGDIFRPLLTEDATYVRQHLRLMSCSVAGLREVYAESGMRHGPMGEALAMLEDRAPTGEDCFGQRVTNATLDLGADIHFGSHPVQAAVPNSGTLVAAGLWADAPPESSPTVEQMLDFRLDAGAARSRVRMWALLEPEGTQAAEGGFREILGVLPNSEHARGVLGSLDSPPAPWLEPPLPWTLGGDPRAEALVLAFPEAHASDICASMDASGLASLPTWSYDEPPADETEEEARQLLCEQLAGPFLQIGWPDAHPEDRMPLCRVLDPAAPVVWSRHHTFDGLDPEQALREWCAAEPSLLRDGGFEADTPGWDLGTGASVTDAVYALGPATGSAMLALRADPDDGVRSVVASQALDVVGATSGGPLPAGDYVLRFRQRVLTHEDNHWVDPAVCVQGTSPWFVARIDSDSGNEILHEDDPSDFCARLIRADGVHYADPVWVPVEVPFTVDADRAGAALTFQVGTSLPHRHVVMVDDVVLERR